MDKVNTGTACLEKALIIVAIDLFEQNINILTTELNTQLFLFYF